MATTELPQSMKAWRFASTAGGLEKNLKLDNAPLPPSASSLGKDDVLVRVSSAAINPVDYKLAELPLVSYLAITKPASPGLDFAGTVVTAGGNVDLKPGQKVLGRLDKPQQFGTLGEYVVAPKAGTVPIPDGVSAEDACCIGTAGLTAYQSIAPHVKRGDNIFINGGSGGTGVFCIQIAKALDCHVTTTCSAPNVEFCQNLGADQVIDYKKSNIIEELQKSGRQYSLIVDNVGTPPAIYWQGKKYATSGAKFVQVGMDTAFSSILDLVKRLVLPDFLGGPGLAFSMMMTKNDQDHLKQIGQWMQEGKVKAVKDSVFAHEDVPKAFERLKTGRARGKIVIKGASE